MRAILKQSWDIYRQHFRVILALVLAIWTPLELLSSYMDTFVFGPDDFRRSWKFAQLLHNFLGIIATAGVIFIGHEALLGRKATFQAAYDVGLRSWGRMWWTRFLSGLAIMLGSLLLLVPGIYLLVRLSLIEPIAVQEQISGPAAMRRSFELTAGRFWLIFRLGLVLMSVFLLPVPVVIAAATIPGLDHWLINAATQLLVDVVAAYATIGLLIAYSHFNDVQPIGNPAPPPIA